MRTSISTSARASRALPRLVGALSAISALAACGNEPSAPRDDLELLRQAALTSDTLGFSIAGGGMLPMIGGLGLPAFAAPPTGPVPGCRVDAASGRTVCNPIDGGGMTFTTSFAYFDAAGAPQDRFGPTTDRVNVRSTMAGTTSFAFRAPDGRGTSITLTVDRRSDQTTSGFATPNGPRRNDGTSSGTEASAITTERGTVRTESRFVDTTINLVLPPPPPRPAAGTAPGGPSIAPVFLVPLSGRVVRVARTTVSAPGVAARTMDLRVVTEFLRDGVVRTTITVDGVTRVCTQLAGRMGPPRCE